MIQNPDFIQRCKVGGIFILQIYKVLTGTMFSLFIPQKCEEDSVCSIEENYHNEDPYHKTVFYVNAFSCLTFFAYYMIELRREEWAIKYLDIDNDKPDNCLKEIIKDEPHLDKRMDTLNLKYFRALQVTGGTYFVNLLLSIKLLKDNYHSSATISTFISFSLLVLMKLYNSFVVAKQSVDNDKMLSGFMSEFVSFNVLDEDYLENKHKMSLTNVSIRLTDQTVVIEPDKFEEPPITDIEEIVPMVDEDK